MKTNGNFFGRLFMLLFVAVIFSECKKKPDEPVYDSELLVYSLNVALVNGGTQDIPVMAFNEKGIRETFSVVSEDPSIATAIVLDTIITVKATGIGKTSIAIKSSSGKTQKLPVNIYIPQVMETDELMISYSQSFSLVFSWNHLMNNNEYSFWHPKTTDGFMPLGSLCIKGLKDPTGNEGVMILKAKEGSDALAAPVDYTLVYNNKNTYEAPSCSFWAPVPPLGYKAMGIVAHKGYNKPDLNYVVCVREDLTIPGEPESPVNVAFIGYTALDYRFFLYKWDIEPPITGPHDNAYLKTGTFVAIGKTSVYAPVHLDPPSVNPVMNVLNVHLQMLSETPYQDYVPKMSGYDVPTAETVPILAREMLVPCTIITDPLNDNRMEKIINSPFYRLERQVYYKLLYHNHNQQSVQNTGKYIVKYGVTKAESTEFWKSTSISIESETGISITDAINQKISITASTELGYSSQTSISELEEKTYETWVNIPAGKAVAIWQRYNRFVLKRHNGTRIESVKAWDIGIESFVTDEYPD